MSSQGNWGQRHSVFSETYKKPIAGWWKKSQRLGQINSYVICLFHSVPAADCTLKIHLCFLAMICEADLVVSRRSPASRDTSSSLHSSLVRYHILRSNCIESFRGGLFKQCCAVLPNSIETPSCAQPSAGHIFKWGYLIFNVMYRVECRSKKQVREENLTKTNGRVGLLDVNFSRF